MSSVDQWSLIVGFLLPPVLAVLMQSHWSNAARAVVAFIACIVAAAGTVYFSGTLALNWSDSKTVSAAALLVLVTAITTYSQFWKPTTIAPKIEGATNLPRLQIVHDAPPAPPAPPASA